MPIRTGRAAWLCLTTIYGRLTSSLFGAARCRAYTLALGRPSIYDPPKGFRCGQVVV
jgi:hypothetical protein